MTPRDRLVQAAAEPLADNAELQLAFRHQLEADLAPEATESDLEAAAERLERPVKDRWRWIWAAVVVALSVIASLWNGQSLVSGYQTLQGISGGAVTRSPLPLGGRDPGKRVYGSLSKAERLLLFGESGHVGEAATWQPLWESEPENPMFFIEYALAYEQELYGLPPDFLEIGREIDPENGWFLIKAAEENHDSVVYEPHPTKADREAGVAPEVPVSDPKELQRRIGWFKQGCAAEKIDSYQNELKRRRFELARSPERFSEHLVLAAHAAGQRVDFLGQGLSRMVQAEAQRCQRDGDREAFIELARAWEVWTSRSIDEVDYLIPGLVTFANMLSTLPAMRDAAVALDVEPERWTALEEKVRARKRRLDDKRGSEDESVDLLNRHGSIMASLAMPMTTRMIEQPPAFTKADLLPGCRIDQAFIGGILSVSGWKLVGLFLVISWVAGITQSSLVKRGTRSLGRLSGMSDALWIGLGGVVLPLLIFLAVRYGTPLSRLDWGPRLTLYAVPVSHFVGLLLMLLVWPAAIASWRVSRFGRVFGWPGAGALALSAMISPLVGMLFFSLAVPPGKDSMVFAGLGIAFGAWSLAWLLGRGFVSAFGNRDKRMPRQAAARLVRPAWLGGLLVMVVLTILFGAEERRWLARDELTRITPSFFAYEGEVADQLKRELKALLE